VSRSSAGRRRRRRASRTWIPRLVLIGPGFVWWLAFFLLPVALLLAYSFLRPGPFGGVRYELTWQNYSRAFDPLYVRVFLSSVRIASIATAVALLIGYPAAYFIANAPSRWRLPLLFLVILPFWTSFLIRTYAWIVLLNPVGLVNRVLTAAGVIDRPLPLLYNGFAIVVGLVYAYIPLMILPIYAALERLGPEPREAASDLYATRGQTLRKVTIPLTLPGIVSGCIFVFVPSLGNFIVPDLLGGGKEIMLGNLIQQQFLGTRNWPFGAVLAMSVVVLMLLLLAAQAQVLRREQVASGR
jgi:spermidine/putrescine transport system permease protein